MHSAALQQQQGLGWHRAGERVAYFANRIRHSRNKRCVARGLRCDDTSCSMTADPSLLASCLACRYSTFSFTITGGCHVLYGEAWQGAQASLLALSPVQLPMTTTRSTSRTATPSHSPTCSTTSR